MTDTAHPLKVEVFDVPAMTNTDPKGFVRAVDEYRATDYGLYMSRSTPGHDKFFWLESWLLPNLDLRANIFHFRNASEEDTWDAYAGGDPRRQHAFSLAGCTPPHPLPGPE